MSQQIVDRVVSMAEEVFQRTVTPADSFFDLGGDSLMALELCLQIEDWVGQPVDMRELVGAGSLEEFAASVSALLGAE